MLKELEVAQKALEKRYLGKKELLHRKALAAELAENVRENVIGVGIGEKRRNNQPQGELCLTIFVRKKLTPGRVADGQQLPAQFRKFVVDVEEMGDIRPAPITGDAVTLLPSQVVRPLQPGCSVGVMGANAQPIAGTFGALVRNGNELFILSNNHVLADENRLALGAPVFQPSPMDSSAQVPVATLATLIPLQTGSPNLMDAAIGATPCGSWGSPGDIQSPCAFRNGPADVVSTSREVWPQHELSCRRDFQPKHRNGSALWNWNADLQQPNCDSQRTWQSICHRRRLWCAHLAPGY